MPSPMQFYKDLHPFRSIGLFRTLLLSWQTLLRKASSKYRKELNQQAYEIKGKKHFYPLVFPILFCLQQEFYDKVRELMCLFCAAEKYLIEVVADENMKFRHNL